VKKKRTVEKPCGRSRLIRADSIRRVDDIDRLSQRRLNNRKRTISLLSLEGRMSASKGRSIALRIGPVNAKVVDSFQNEVSLLDPFTQLPLQLKPSTTILSRPETIRTAFSRNLRLLVNYRF
jgi:hypothetical protein